MIELIIAAQAIAAFGCKNPAQANSSFYDCAATDVVFLPAPVATDLVCASANPPGPWTQASGRPGNFIRFDQIAPTLSICICNVVTCKTGNNIEAYTLKSTFGGTPTPPVIQPPTAGDGTAKLDWTAPLVDTDGKAVGTITGYNLFYGMNPASLDKKVSLLATPQTYTLTSLATGTYYFAMTTLVGSEESARTNLASKNVIAGTSPPPPPPVTPPVVPPVPTLTVTPGTWAAMKAGKNLKTGLATHEDCLTFIKTQPKGSTYACGYSGEKVTIN